MCHIMEAVNELDIAWFNQYRQPTEVVLDRVKEFMGEVIRMMREDYNVKRKLIPQVILRPP